MENLHIGCAAGFSGDRTDAARAVVDTLVARGAPSVLMFETLAERTLALAQLARLANPSQGFEPLLEDMLLPVLAQCLEHRVRIVGNFGAANPTGAAKFILGLAEDIAVRAPKIAVVLGDDLAGPNHRAMLEREIGSSLGKLAVVSANAYLGAEMIADALSAGADIVVCGRVADPSLAVGPVMSHFGWRADEWEKLGRATMAGHLLECGSQVTGGYFADPGFKDVPDVARVGFPIAEISADGGCVIGKADGTGGLVSEATVKEQLLYEVHDPAAYLTPDVTADISQAQVHEVSEDRVELTGVRGHARPAKLKVNVGYQGGWLAEGEISYAGPNAEARARLAGDILRERLPELEVRIDLIGVTSVFGDDGGTWLARVPRGGHTEVRLRVAAKHADRRTAERLDREVTALYTCGPAGGGGVRTSLRSRLDTLSCFVPREAVEARWEKVGAW